MTQIADALFYLHNASIVHGDIKPASVRWEFCFGLFLIFLQSNVLINDKGEASLADFGTAIILQKSGFTTRTTAGTWRFMAPELMEADEVHTQVSKATDIYAVAMTYVEVLLAPSPVI